MKNAVKLWRPALCVLAGVMTGCGTLVLPQRPPENETAQAAQEDLQRRAEALAQFSMAVRESEAGNTDEVIERYRAAVSNDPGNVQLELELAMIYIHEGRYEEFDALIDSVLARDPALVRALRVKSFGYRLRGQLREALPPVEDAIKLEPGELSHYIEAAALYNRLGDQLAASEVLERSVHTVTNRPQAFQALAHLYIEQAKKARKDGTSLSPSHLELIKLAAEDFPDDLVLHILYADLLLLNEQIEEAIGIYARAEEKNPDDRSIPQKLALGLVALGDNQRAIELLSDAARRNPSNYRLWMFLGELYEREGDIENALVHYRKSIEARPDMVDTHIKLAHFLLVNKREAEAITALVLAREKHPGDHRIAELLAYAYAREDQYPEAAAVFLAAEKLIQEQSSKPILNTFYSSAANAHQLAGATNETIRLLTEGMARDPDIINEYLSFALRSREGSARLKTCMEILDALSDRLPKQSSTSIMLGLLAMKSRDYAAAIEHLTHAETMAKSDGNEQILDAQFYFWLASAYERNKEYDRAEEIFLSIIAKEPDHADALNYVAYMNAERGVKLEAALDQVGVALAMDPDNAAYIDTRGWIFFKMGQYKKALEDIAYAAEKIPEDATIADHLGDIHLALGDEQEAIAWWKKSNAADPTNETVREKLTSRGIEAIEAPAITETAEDMKDEEEELIDDVRDVQATGEEQPADETPGVIEQE